MTMGVCMTRSINYKEGLVATSSIARFERDGQKSSCMFEPFLSDGSFFVRLGSFLHRQFPFLQGAPGVHPWSSLVLAVPALLWFCFREHSISFHCYADDWQVYSPLRHNSPTPVEALFDFLKVFKVWMAENFLKLNDQKTGSPVFGPLHLHFKHSVKKPCCYPSQQCNTRETDRRCCRSSLFPAQGPR